MCPGTAPGLTPIQTETSRYPALSVFPMEKFRKIPTRRNCLSQPLSTSRFAERVSLSRRSLLLRDTLARVWMSSEAALPACWKLPWPPQPGHRLSTSCQWPGIGGPSIPLWKSRSSMALYLWAAIPRLRTFPAPTSNSASFSPKSPPMRRTLRRFMTESRPHSRLRSRRAVLGWVSGMPEPLSLAQPCRVPALPLRRGSTPQPWRSQWLPATMQATRWQSTTSSTRQSSPSIPRSWSHPCQIRLQWPPLPAPSTASSIRSMMANGKTVISSLGWNQKRPTPFISGWRLPPMETIKPLNRLLCRLQPRKLDLPVFRFLFLLVLRARPMMAPGCSTEWAVSGTNSPLVETPFAWLSPPTSPPTSTRPLSRRITMSRARWKIRQPPLRMWFGTHYPQAMSGQIPERRPSATVSGFIPPSAISMSEILRQMSLWAAVPLTPTRRHLPDTACTSPLRAITHLTPAKPALRLFSLRCLPVQQ